MTTYPRAGSVADRERFMFEVTRERLIAREELADLNDRLKMCYLREGVNHGTRCRDLVVEYTVRTTQWKNDVPFEDGEAYGSTTRLRVRRAGQNGSANDEYVLLH